MNRSSITAQNWWSIHGRQTLLYSAYAAIRVGWMKADCSIPPCRAPGRRFVGARRRWGDYRRTLFGDNYPIKPFERWLRTIRCRDVRSGDSVRQCEELPAAVWCRRYLPDRCGRTFPEKKMILRLRASFSTAPSPTLAAAWPRSMPTAESPSEGASKMSVSRRAPPLRSPSL